MILQALAKLAAVEDLVKNPHYETKEIHWRVTLTHDGRFVGLESLLQAPAAEARGKMSRPRGPSVLVPRPFPGARPAGVQPDASFLVGNPSFAFGLDLTAEKKYSARPGELKRRSNDFRALVAQAAQATDDKGLIAVRDFLNSGDETRRVRKAIEMRAEAKELATNHLIAFRLDGDECPYVHVRPGVMDYWARYRGKLEGQEETGQCLVTGAVAPLIDKHPPIKKVPGGTPSGVAIVSFNSSAFESYGFERNENAPVSRGAAEAYTTALNRLLDPATPDPRNPNVRLPEQRVLLSDDTVAVFWTDRRSRVPAALVPAVGSGDPDAARELGITLEVDDSYAGLAKEDDGPPSPEPIRVAHEAPWKGITPKELSDPSAFRLLILTGGQGRATVRSFHTSRVADTVKAVREWFADIRLDTLRRRPALNRLLSGLALRGERKNLPPSLAGDIFLAILAGRALPVAVLEAAVRRCRSEPGSTQRDGTARRRLKVSPERAALIKAHLNRERLRLGSSRGIRFQEVRPTMNDDERNRGYLLGRMFACIERMQELALGEVGASVTDRYFGAACATPQAVFPRLLKTEVHHFRKAREGERAGAARWLNGQVSRLAVWLVGEQNGMHDGESLDAFLHRIAGRALVGFPTFLPLPEQGLFTLGYHQQRAEFFKKREGPVENAKDEPTPTTK